MMAFQANFISAVLVNNIPQQETNVNNVRTVFLEDGQEYALRLINKNKYDACCSIEIDSVDISPEGKRLLLNSDATIDLDRFMGEKHRFKFVSLEAPEALVHDKNNKELGKVRVKFYKRIDETPFYTLGGGYINTPFWQQGPGYSPWVSPFIYGVTSTGGPDVTITASNNAFVSLERSASVSSTSFDLTSQKGATVQGSESKQTLQEGPNFRYTEYPVATIELQICVKPVEDVAVHSSYAAGNVEPKRDLSTLSAEIYQKTLFMALKVSAIAERLGAPVSASCSKDLEASINNNLILSESLAQDALRNLDTISEYLFGEILDGFEK